MGTKLPTNRSGEVVREFVEIRVAKLEAKMKLAQERLLKLEAEIKELKK